MCKFKKIFYKNDFTISLLFIIISILSFGIFLTFLTNAQFFSPFLYISLTILIICILFFFWYNYNRCNSLKPLKIINYNHVIMNDKNQTLYKNKFNLTLEILIPLLSFGIPLLICFILFATNNFYPFDKNGNTFMTIDAQSQYIAYFRYYKALLSNDSNMIYTMSKTFGGNMVSILAYYLNSPFNPFVKFVDYQDIPTFILIICWFKMAFCSLNFYLLTRFYTKEAKLSNLIFSLSYCMCSFFFINLSNFMWLDGVCLLPLVFLAYKLLINDKVIFLYPFTIAFVLYTSWYIGFMVCVFIGLIFITDCISGKIPFKSKNLFISTPIKFINLSILGGLIGAIFWYAAFTHFAGTKASGFTIGIQSNAVSFTDLIRGLLTNSFTSSEQIKRNTGYYSSFTSTLILALFPLFFFIKDIKLRKKLSYLVLLLFYLFAPSISLFDSLLHGGSIPSWFPSRYSFVTSFLLTFLAFISFINLKKIHYFGYIINSLLFIISLIVVLNNPAKSIENINVNKFYQLSIGGIIVYLITFIYCLTESFLMPHFKKISKYFTIVSSFILVPLTCYSSFLSNDNIIKTNIKENEYQNISEYLEDNSRNEMFEKLISYDPLQLNRMEDTTIRPGSYNSIDNDPMFYFGFNGLSHYSSTSLKDVMNYMNKIGFHSNSYFQKYNLGSTLAMNSFLNIKYLMSENNKPAFINNLKVLEKTNDATYYLNPYSLNLGMISNKTSSDFINEGYYVNDNEIKWFNIFEYQNEIFKSLTNSVKNEDETLKDIFSPISFKNVSCTSNITKLPLTADKIQRFDGKKGGKITVTFDNITLNKFNTYIAMKNITGPFNIYYNNLKLDMNSYWSNGIYPIKLSSSNKVEITLTSDVRNMEILPQVYYEDLNILQEYINSINTSYLELTYKKQSYFKQIWGGKFNLNENNKQILFTLPYEKGFQIKIDGKDVKTYKSFNIFTAGDLSNIKQGEHTFEIIYTELGYIKGLYISIISFSLLLCYLIYLYKDKLFIL